MTWQDDKRWSDRFVPQIKGILGEHLISESPVEEDAERNSDLIVLTLNAVRIACRIRKYQYLQSFGNEFTVRAGRPSGNKTELAKIIEGWGDFFFYGFSDQEESVIIQWRLICLKSFRLWLWQTMRMNNGELPGKMMTNKDGSGCFAVFRTEEIPTSALIASHLAILTRGIF